MDITKDRIGNLSHLDNWYSPLADISSVEYQAQREKINTCLSTAMEIGAQIGSDRFTTSHAQYDFADSNTHVACTGHYAAFNHDERVVLCRMDDCQFCVPHSNCPYNGPACGELCTALLIITEGPSNNKYCCS